jgi:hypothetical protein
MARQTIEKELTQMANIRWEYLTQDMRKPIVIPIMEQGQESQEFEILISHDSARPITGCSIYVSPYSGNYLGTHSPLQDFERLLWFADNYPGFGLSVQQEYIARGTIDSYSAITTNVRFARLIDLDRPETTDIFAGEVLKLTSGEEADSESVISSYDPVRKLINLSGSFFTDISNDNYEIAIQKEDFFKSKVGSSFSNPIPILNKGGIISRFEKIMIKVKLRLPPFALSAGVFYFDLNMRYTSMDEVI